MKCLKPNILDINWLIQRTKKSKKILKYLHKQNNGNIAVPCGKCWMCRQRLAREQATQIAKEIKEWPKNERFFLTLTYRNANLPQNWYQIEKDKKKLIKKLHNKNRIWNPNKNKREAKKLKYYLVFERSDTWRPHFHMILCGVKINDLIFNGTSEKSGLPLFISKQFQNTYWKWGMVKIGTLTAKSAGYCAGYVLKKCDKNYDYQLQKWQPNDRTVWKWQSPGWGLKWALTHPIEVKMNTKYHTRYWTRKIKETMNEKQWIKYLKHTQKPDKRPFWQKWLFWKNWAIAWNQNKKPKRIDRLGD